MNTFDHRIKNNSSNPIPMIIEESEETEDLSARVNGISKRKLPDEGQIPESQSNSTLKKQKTEDFFNLHGLPVEMIKL